MTSSYILYVYIFFFAAHLLVELGLAWLNLREVQRNRLTLPTEFKDTFTFERYQRACDYSLAKLRLAVVSDAVSSVITLAVILSEAFGSLDSLLRDWTSNMYIHGIAYVLILSALFTLIGLPFSYYATFVLEQRFGFNRNTPKQWIADLCKQLILSSVLISILLAGLFWFMQSAGNSWWLYAFAFVAIFQLTLIYVYPSWIAPLFNKFTPLEQNSLREKISSLAAQAKFGLSDIFVMDGSRRSSHSNAFFTGFGKSKRIVLFDTLIDTLSEEELVAVLAHEMGHEKLRHVVKMLALSLFVLLLSLWIIANLMNIEEFYRAFGFTQASYHAALIVFAFASSPITFFLSPLSAVMSRRHEYEADAFACKLVDNSKDLRNALLNLSKENLSNLTPHPWYSFFHYSHPTLRERLLALK